MIYKSVDKNGNVVFSDQPSANAEKIEERLIPTIKSPRVHSDSESKPTDLEDPKKKGRTDYDELVITSPAHNESIRANNGDINVDITVMPALREKLGHKLVLFLDGKPVSKGGTATTFALHGVERGEHTLAAVIIGKNGESIETAESVTVHLKRFSIKHPPVN